MPDATMLQRSCRASVRQVTENPAEADFILAHGTEAISAADGSGGAAPQSVEQLEMLLRQAADAGQPPMVVANPGSLPGSRHCKTCCMHLIHVSFNWITFWGHTYRHSLISD